MSAVDGSWHAAPRRKRRRIAADLLAIGPSLLLLWDFLAVAGAGLVSALLYRAIFPGRVFDIALHGSFGREVLLQACVCPLLMRELGGNRGLDRGLPDILRAACFLPALLIAVGFATRALGDLSRAWVLLWSVTALGFVVAGRGALGHAVGTLRRRGRLCQRIAIVGAGPLADGLIDHLDAVAPLTTTILGVFDDRRSRLLPCCHPPGGTVADLIELGRQDPPDWIVIALPATAERRIAALVRELKSVCAQIAVCPPDIGQRWIHDAGPGVDFLGGAPLRVLARPPLRRWSRAAKAVEDRLLGLLLLVLLAPLMLAIALALRLEGSGPALFRQLRQGWNNQEFEILKFRTMHWHLCHSAMREQTSRDDPRVTRLGRLLRATSLDELPQLINVLRGEMSLVGPRPHALTMRTEDRLGQQIVAEYAHRHRVKPGITGWAQIHGLRGATSTAEQLRQRVAFDLYYIDNWSVLLDLEILLRTALRVLGDGNAY